MKIYSKGFGVHSYTIFCEGFVDDSESISDTSIFLSTA